MLVTIAVGGCQQTKSGSPEPATSPEPVTSEAYNCELGDEGLNFTTIGAPWSNRRVSVSFMTDGTPNNGTTSRLFALLDGVAPRAVWQREYARALATWAKHANVNFRFAADDGTAPSSAGPAQADNRFGDIRIGARDLGTQILAKAAGPSTSGTLYGDVYFNTIKVYSIGGPRDVYTIALHELGHSLGLGHSTIFPSAMYPGTQMGMTDLKQDDIDGVQSLYGARVADAYDIAAANETIATATALAVTATGQIHVNGDLTSEGDVDHYRIVVPEGAESVLSVTSMRDQSTLIPTLKLYDEAGNLLTEATASSYGESAVVQVSVVAGQSYVVAVETPTLDVFGFGAYRLALEFRAGVDGVPFAAPANLALDARELNDSITNYSNLGQISSSLTVSSLATHWMWDEDFFGFQAGKNSSQYEVAVTQAQGTPRLEIEVMNTSGSVLAKSNGASLIRFPVSSSGFYRIRIFNPARLPIGYSMTVRKTQ